MSTQQPRTSIWRRYLEFPLIWKMTIALVAGVIVGLAVGKPVTVIQPLGDIFLRLLEMMVMPLIISTLIAGVSSISPARLGRIGTKVLLYYLVTSAFAIVIGLLIALAIAPGAGLSMPSDGEKPEKAPPIGDTLLGIIPENPFQALVDGNVLAIMFLSVAAGLALTFMRDSNTPRVRELGDFLRRGVDAAVELVFLVIRGVLQYAPIGVFALIAAVIGETGAGAIVPLAKLTGVSAGATALMLVVYAGMMAVFRIRVSRFYSAAKEPMVTAFVTRSSSGTLPVSSRAAERLGISEGVYGFTLPLGATINMDGTAIYVGAATVFVANVQGVELSVAQLAMVVLVGVLASVGTAGVPGAGLIMLSMVISQTGLSFAPVALVAGIDAILDMIRTMCNVTGDLAGTSVIAKTEKGMMRVPEVDHAGRPAGTVERPSADEGAAASGGDGPQDTEEDDST